MKEDTVQWKRGDSPNPKTLKEHASGSKGMVSGFGDQKREAMLDIFEDGRKLNWAF